MPRPAQDVEKYEKKLIKMEHTMGLAIKETARRCRLGGCGCGCRAGVTLGAGPRGGKPGSRRPVEPWQNTLVIYSAQFIRTTKYEK